jgi:hypothetical protein
MVAAPDNQKFITLFGVSMVFYGAALGAAISPLGSVAIDPDISIWKFAGYEVLNLLFLSLPLILYYIGLRTSQRRYLQAFVLLLLFISYNNLLAVGVKDFWNINSGMIRISGLGIGSWMFFLGFISRQGEHD